MKKLLAMLTSVVLGTSSMQAQSLYKTVFDKATSIVNNPNSSNEQIEINQFQVTALNYISTQVKKRGLEKDTYFYDSQAVNLASFVTDFLANLEKARTISSTKRTEVIRIYTDASKQNPLFKDTDKEKVNCYVDDKQALTPFCIDTDWEKAYDQATLQIKKVLK